MTASHTPPRPSRGSGVGRSEPKPPWLKVKAPGGPNYARIKRTLRSLDLNTVCEEARCPNVGECWSAGTATVMLLGHTCTRGCRFCAVTTGNPQGAYDPREPEHVARAIAGLGLKYVVLTMVDRDDLLDGGAALVAQTVRALAQVEPDLLVETLVGDFGGRRADVWECVDGGPHVFAHNVEVPRRLTPTIRDRRCGYDLSLDVLRIAKDRAPDRMTKSSIMVGIGETDEEVFETLSDLKAAGVSVVTLGQYLRPTPKHAAVDRWVTPAAFAEYERVGLELGLSHVASGPLVRSSYHAAEAYIAARVRPAGVGLESGEPALEAGLVPVGALVRKSPEPAPSRAIASRRCSWVRTSCILRRPGPAAGVRFPDEFVCPGLCCPENLMDQSLINKVAAKLGEPASYAMDGAKGSILTVAAASFGSRPEDEEITRPTGFDPLAAALFEAVVESAYLVANADGEFDATEQAAFRQVVVAACGDRVGPGQVVALMADLEDQLAEDGMNKRVEMVGRTIRKAEHAREVLRVASLLAHVSGGVSSEERDVLQLLADQFDLDGEALDVALGEAESALAE